MAVNPLTLTLKENSVQRIEVDIDKDTHEDYDVSFDLENNIEDPTELESFTLTIKKKIKV